MEQNGERTSSVSASEMKQRGMVAGTLLASFSLMPLDLILASEESFLRLPAADRWILRLKRAAKVLPVTTAVGGIAGWLLGSLIGKTCNKEMSKTGAPVQKSVSFLPDGSPPGQSVQSKESAGHYVASVSMSRSSQGRSR